MLGYELNIVGHPSQCYWIAVSDICCGSDAEKSVLGVSSGVTKEHHGAMVHGKTKL